ncbi:hypothetical protein PVK06_012700 [Gossypium arboreum]|uniref:Uncharacterized protein n=1 Tax=Gossypium arboreum TaxID=29729 RepID=A0ABR0QC68_GOSAR|nr:hypothetical protein PVK06_012700 [Gossypium arboreum]
MVTNLVSCEIDLSIDFEWGLTKWAIKLEMVKPTVKAILMKYVTTIEFPHMFLISYPAQTHHIIPQNWKLLPRNSIYMKNLIQVELLHEYDKVNQARTYDSGIVDKISGLVEAVEEADGIEKTKKEVLKIAKAVGDECNEKKWDRIYDMSFSWPRRNSWF